MLHYIHVRTKIKQFHYMMTINSLLLGKVIKKVTFLIFFFLQFVTLKKLKFYRSSKLSDLLHLNEQKLTKLSFQIIQINKSAFTSCKYIEIVEIEKNSKLQLIDDSVFEYSSLIKIFIPNQLIKIGDYAFDGFDLEKIQFDCNSKLNEIGKNSFFNSGIHSFFVPKTGSKNGEKALDKCQDLQIVELNENYRNKSSEDLIILFKSSNAIIMISN